MVCGLLEEGRMSSRTGWCVVIKKRVGCDHPGERSQRGEEPVGWNDTKRLG